MSDEALEPTSPDYDPVDHTVEAGNDPLANDEGGNAEAPAEGEGGPEQPEQPAEDEGAQPQASPALSSDQKAVDAAYVPPPSDFEHTAFSPDDNQHIS